MKRDFIEGFLAGMLGTFTLFVIVLMVYIETNNQQQGWHVDANYYGAYADGLKTIPRMQEQDSIDTEILNLQERYNLSDEDTEKLYESLVD